MRDRPRVLRPGLSAGYWALPFRGALVRRTADATSLAFSWIAVWRSAVYDTDAFWSAGNPTRLTVPAGVTRVRLHGSVRFPDAAGTRAINLQILRNGAAPSATYPGTAAWSVRVGGTGFSDNAAFFITPVRSVSPGDWFELRVNRTGLGTSTTVLADAANTGTATLDVDGLGAVPIRKADGTVELDVGDLPASALITVVHDGTVFRLA